MQNQSIEQQYLQSLKDLKQYGVKKALFNADLGREDSEMYIQSLLGRTFYHRMEDGFPLYTSKYVYWRGAIAEMLWFIQGRADLNQLRDMSVGIWDSWGHREWAKQNEGSLEIYRQISPDNDEIKLHYTNITDWRGTGLNQTEWVMEELPKRPYRKSYVVTYLDPTTTYQMADKSGEKSVSIVACHYEHHLLCQRPNRLSLTVAIRSQDMFLGHPFNVAQYAALLEMYCVCIANRTGEVWTSDEFVLNCTGDYHLYSNQFEQVNVQLQNETHSFPKLVIKDRGQTSLRDFQLSDFCIEGYKHSGKLKKVDVYVAGGY